MRGKYTNGQPSSQTPRKDQYCTNEKIYVSRMGWLGFWFLVMVANICPPCTNCMSWTRCLGLCTSPCLHVDCCILYVFVACISCWIIAFPHNDFKKCTLITCYISFIPVMSLRLHVSYRCLGGQAWSGGKTSAW